MHIHGRNDPIISYSNLGLELDEVGRMMDIPSLVQYWRNKHQCRLKAQRVKWSTHYVYGDCKQNAMLNIIVLMRQAMTGPMK